MKIGDLLIKIVEKYNLRFTLSWFIFLYYPVNYNCETEKQIDRLIRVVIFVLTFWITLLIDGFSYIKSRM